MYTQKDKSNIICTFYVHSMYTQKDKSNIIYLILKFNTVNALTFTVHYYSRFFSKIKIRENSYREFNFVKFN